MHFLQSSCESLSPLFHAQSYPLSSFFCPQHCIKHDLIFLFFSLKREATATDTPTGRQQQQQQQQAQKASCSPKAKKQRQEEKGESGSSSLSSVGERTREDSEGFVTCPICSQSVALGTINGHVDECLSVGEIKSVNKKRDIKSYFVKK